MPGGSALGSASLPELENKRMLLLLTPLPHKLIPGTRYHQHSTILLVNTTRHLHVTATAGNHSHTTRIKGGNDMVNALVNTPDRPVKGHADLIPAGYYTASTVTAFAVFV